ncbi:MAG: M20 family peptidase [Halioglobus sp.]
MNKLFKAGAALILLLIGVLVVNTVRFAPVQGEPVTRVQVPVDAQLITTHMAQAIRIPTIATGDDATQEYDSFREFIAWAQQTYPLVYSSMTLQMIAEHTILLRWQGSNSTLKPILLTGHYDVVPVVAGSEGQWKHPPFSGDVAEGYVWGRGALDDKSGVIVMYEAATLLLQQGFQPERTVYFSFGHDEETGGRVGAAGVASYLKAQGVQLAWTIDEGSFVVEDAVPGIDTPVASINVAEKGSVTLELVASGPGGHSSMPEAELAIDILAQALVNLRQHPLPGGLEGLSAESFDIMGRHLPFGPRLLMANRWLFGPLLESQLSKEARIDALLRTTTAPTLLRAGIKSNVIPPAATAIVNFRLHPRDTAEGVVTHVVAAINDERVTVRITGDGMSSPPSGISSRDSEGYRTISRVVRQIYGDVVVTPGMTVGGTDSKHYGKVSDDTYRINLMKITPADVSGFHGKNERIAIDNLVTGTGAYYQLIKEATGRSTQSLKAMRGA